VTLPHAAAPCFAQVRRHGVPPCAAAVRRHVAQPFAVQRKREAWPAQRAASPVRHGAWQRGHAPQQREDRRGRHGQVVPMRQRLRGTRSTARPLLRCCEDAAAWQDLHMTFGWQCAENRRVPPCDAVNRRRSHVRLGRRVVAKPGRFPPHGNVINPVFEAP
jgi:hypothetical protein